MQKIYTIEGVLIKKQCIFFKKGEIISYRRLKYYFTDDAIEKLYENKIINYMNEGKEIPYPKYM
jgi:ABC-type cobalamin/Fe3+-siderophores transport system ATPase subunit